MRIYPKDLVDKQEVEIIPPAIIPEAEQEEVIEAQENVPTTVDEKFVIKVGDLWFKLLCPYTLVESRDDAAILSADVARAQSHRILRIKKMKNEILPA
jgi:hypothetical protein